MPRRLSVSIFRRQASVALRLGIRFGVNHAVEVRVTDVRNPTQSSAPAPISASVSHSNEMCFLRRRGCFELGHSDRTTSSNSEVLPPRKRRTDGHLVHRVDPQISGTRVVQEDIVAAVRVVVGRADRLAIRTGIADARFRPWACRADEDRVVSEQQVGTAAANSPGTSVIEAGASPSSKS
jgi:hypothetical protein